MENTYECSRYHNREKKEKTPEDKIAALRKAITDLGYNVEENDNGEIIVSE